MGTIYKRGGIYYINLICDGKRHRRRAGTSKKVAELALKDLELQIERKSFDLDVPDTTIEDLFQSYLTFSETNHAPATTKRYGNVIQNFRLFAALNHPMKKRVSQIDMVIIEEFIRFRRTVDPRTLNLPDGFPYTVRANSLSGRTRTVNYEIKTLRSIFNFGKKRRLCRGNPCDGVPGLKITDSKPPRFLTADEYKSFLQSCDEVLYPIFYTFLNTGLRLGEFLNLQWSDIDFRRRKLMIRRKASWQPKAGEREIPLNDGMMKLLHSIKPKRSKKVSFVFPAKDGGKLKRKLRKDLIRIANKAGLDEVTKIHSLRHTFASHLVMKGVDLPTVQRLLGHSDIQTTMIYAHLAPDHLVDAVNKLEINPD